MGSAKALQLISGAVVLGISLHLSAAPMYRWVDDKGKVHYSDALPPQQAGRGHRELDKQGRVTQDISRTDAVNGAARERLEEGQRAASTQERRDRALLSTYASVEEIHQARERANRLAGGKLKSLQIRWDEATAAMKKMTGGKSLVDPAKRKLVEDSQAELDALSKGIAKQEQELKDMNNRFESDIIRYQQLTGLTPRTGR